MRTDYITTQRESQVLRHALSLLRLGWSIVPLHPKSKLPVGRWKAYQRRQLTENEIISIFEQNPDANLGVVTGKASQLLVLDADAPDVVKKLGVPETPIVETARGKHYYFQLPDAKIKSVTRLADGLDVKANGGYVVSPPSLHPSGKQYQWVIPPRGVDHLGAEPAPPPAWLIDMIRKHRARQGAPDLASIVHGVPQGKRNVSAAALAGKLLGCLPIDDWESVAWELLKAWNFQNKPPLPERELRQVFESIAQREIQGRAKSKEAKLRSALKNLSQQLKISQRQLSQLTKIPQKTLNRWLTDPHIPYDPYDPFNPHIPGNDSLSRKKFRIEADFDSESESQLCERDVKRQNRSGIRCKPRTVHDFERR